MLHAQPIVPWIGGKRRLVKHILPLIPRHRCYVEPFAGGAAVLFNKQPSEVEVLNDLNGDLVNLYRVVQHHLEEFVRQFRWALVSRQIYEWMQDTPPYVLTDIQRAARFYYLQKLAFGGKVQGQSFGTSATSGPRLNLLRIEEELSAAHLRLAPVVVENLAWQDCLSKYDGPDTVFFADPPYWETEGYGNDFGLEQYEQLAQQARDAEGLVIITVNDHEKMREVFADLPTQQLSIRYSVGSAHGAAATTGELLIRNRDEGFNGQQNLI